MMKPRAFYRSVVFWLGVFVLVFLVWAWVVSLKWGAYVTRQGVMEGVPPGEADLMRVFFMDGAKLQKGTVTVLYTRMAKRKPFARVRYDPVNYQAVRMVPPYSMPALNPGNDDAAVAARMAMVRRYRVAVPMWGIVGGYVLCGAGAMVWWRRRCRRMMGNVGTGDGGG